MTQQSPNPVDVINRNKCSENMPKTEQLFRFLMFYLRETDRMDAHTFSVADNCQLKTDNSVRRHNPLGGGK